MRHIIALTILVLTISAPVSTSPADSPPAPPPRVHSPPPAADMRPVQVPPILRPVAPYLSIVQRESKAHGVPASLVVTLILVESGGRVDAVSSEGALSLMQIMPMHADMCDYCDLRIPENNIRVGVLLLRGYADWAGASAECLAQGPGGDGGCAWRTDLALSAYNSGPRGGFQRAYVAAVRNLWPEVKGAMAA